MLWDSGRWTGSIQRVQKKQECPDTLHGKSRREGKRQVRRVQTAAAPWSDLHTGHWRATWLSDTGRLTLSTCSRFSSLPRSWFLSNRAKSLSCVTAPRVSLRLTYSDFIPKTQKRGQVNYIWAWLKWLNQTCDGSPWLGSREWQRILTNIWKKRAQTAKKWPGQVYQGGSRPSHQS